MKLNLTTYSLQLYNSFMKQALENSQLWYYWENVSDPFKNKSLLIEGDVFLQPTHPAIPVMTFPARNKERVTFKEWIKEVAAAKKGNYCFPIVNITGQLL